MQQPNMNRPNFTQGDSDAMPMVSALGQSGEIEVGS